MNDKCANILRIMGSSAPTDFLFHYWLICGLLPYKWQPCLSWQTNIAWRWRSGVRRLMTVQGDPPGCQRGSRRSFILVTSGSLQLNSFNRIGPSAGIGLHYFYCGVSVRLSKSSTYLHKIITVGLYCSNDQIILSDRCRFRFLSGIGFCHSS